MSSLFLFIYRLHERIQVRARTFWWRHTLASFGKGSFVTGRIRVYNPKELFIGSSTTINEGAILNARARIIIGNHVHISSTTTINTGGLVYEKTLDERVHTERSVHIKDGAWIGSGSLINPGVTIGENTVIGAGSVVTKDIPPNVVAVGNPARVIKSIGETAS